MSIIGACEIGTTSAKFLILDGDKILAIAASDEYAPSHPEPGASRQDPEVWWKAFNQAMRNACKEAGIEPKAIQCLVVSGQMHGFCPVRADGSFGEASLWNDSTAKEDAANFEVFASDKGLDTLSLTGNVPGPNFTAAKILQMRRMYPECHKSMKCFVLPAGTVTMRLIGEPVIDPSDASGTILWDIEHRKWSEELLDLVGVLGRQPRLVESLEFAGEVTEACAEETGLMKGTQVLAGGADQSETAEGMGIIPSNTGAVSFTWGTSGVITAALNKPDPDERLNTFAHVEDVISFLCTCACGDTQSKVMELLGITIPAAMDAMAAQSPIGSNGTIILPLFSGTRMFDNFSPNGTILGMSMATTREDICRASQEGIIFEALLGLEVLKSKAVPVHRIMFGGGGAKSKHLAQMVANITGCKVTVPVITETTVLGAAIRGAVAMEDFEEIDDACEALVKPHFTFEPNWAERDRYKEVFARFQRAISNVADGKVLD